MLRRRITGGRSQRENEAAMKGELHGRRRLHKDQGFSRRRACFGELLVVRRQRGREVSERCGRRIKVVEGRRIALSIRDRR